MSKQTVLINFDQFKIKRIAVNYDNAYYKCFVYVETEGELQSGLYNFTNQQIKEHVNTFGYSWEEYGVLKKKIGREKFISREEHDDGATVIKGKVKNVRTEIRARYLTDFNFLITAQEAPYNSIKFIKSSDMYFNGILNKTINPNDFFDFLKTFNKYER